MGEDELRNAFAEVYGFFAFSTLEMYMPAALGGIDVLVQGALFAFFIDLADDSLTLHLGKVSVYCAEANILICVLFKDGLGGKAAMLVVSEQVEEPFALLCFILFHLICESFAN